MSNIAKTFDIPLLPIHHNEVQESQSTSNTFNQSQKFNELKQTSTIKSQEQINKMIEDLYCKVDFEKIPGDFILAEDHRKATRVGPELNEKEKRTLSLGEDCNKCDCCGRNVERKPLDLNCNITDLSFLGSGFPMFFQFVKLIILYLVIILMLSGLYNIFQNEKGAECQPINTKLTCYKNWVNVYTLGNRSNDESSIFMQQWLNLLTIFALIAYTQYIIYTQRQLDQLADEVCISPGDYTVMISNIPIEIQVPGFPNIDYDDDLKEFLENRCLVGIPLRVARVNMCYNLTELQKLKEKKEKVIKQKQKLLKEQLKMQKLVSDSNNTVEFDMKIKDINKEIEQFEFKMGDGKGTEFMKKYFVGIALVTFQSEQEKEDIIELAKNKQIIYRKNVLRIRQAPEPTEIFWENLNVSLINRIIRIGAAIILGLVCLFCGSIIIYLLCYVQYNYTKNRKEVMTFKEKAIIQSFSFMISTLIFVINLFLIKAVREVVNFKKLHTRTNYNLGFAYFLCLAQFVNSILIPLLVKIILNDTTYYSMLYNRAGVLNNQNSIFLFNTFLPIIMFFISYPNLIKNYFRNKALKDKEKCVLTQKELLTAFEEPPFMIEFQYSQTMRTLFMTLAYCTVMPICILYSILALTIQYFTSKYDLIKRRTVPYNMGSSLSYNMIEMLKMSIIIYSFSAYFFIQMTTDTDYYDFPALIGIIVAIAHFFVPIKLVNQQYFQTQNAPPNQETYDQVKLNFITDYDRENPATKRQATIDYLKVTEKKQYFQNEMLISQLMTSQVEENS
ncbi:hypothetical protein ABPG74_007582 [Tetrahymena malaccensis]